MSLKVSRLQEITQEIKKEQALLESLKLETKNVFGKNISITGGLEHACYQVNNLLDILEAKNQVQNVTFKTTLAKKLLESKCNEAKRLGARTIPLNLAEGLRFDYNQDVRLEVCKRLNPELIDEVLDLFPEDFELQYVVEQKKKKQKEDSFLHIYDDKRLGASAKPFFQPELSDAWYHTVASKFLQDYGSNIEYQWEEPLVHRYCSSVKQSTGVDVDESKLYDKIQELIRQKEDDALLKAEKMRIKKLEKFRESVERKNPEDDLTSIFEETLSNVQKIAKLNEIFQVKQSIIPPGIRKYSNSSVETFVPMKAKIPGGKLTSLVERALDSYVDCWNNQQLIRGEPIKISWSTDQGNSENVCFSLELR